MKVFVTGAAGFVGSAVVQELLKAGHQVTGLARSEANVEALKKAGVEVHRGSLQDLESLKSGAAHSDGVIHCAFNHEFKDFAKDSEDEKRAIEALGSALAGTSRPLVVTSGVALLSPGIMATENTVRSLDHPFPRDPESAAFAFMKSGVRVTTVRLSPVTHDQGKGGFATPLIQVAREKGFSAYVGDGQSVWSAVHRLDAALLFRLALEEGVSGGRYHAVADEGIHFKDLATVIGKKLKLPVASISADQVAGHFGWFANFAILNAPASSKKTQELLGWKPRHPGLLADIEASEI